MGLLQRWRRGRELRERADRLYGHAVARARRPVFYADCGVPDTPDGRFDMIALQVFLLLRRMRGLPQAGDLPQRLVEVMVDDMDRSLREMGVGDLAVGPRVKKLMEHFNGRMAAYHDGFDGTAEDLHAALRRNVYRKGAPEEARLVALERRLRADLARLEALDDPVVLEARLETLPDADD